MTPELKEAASKCPVVAALHKAGETPEGILLLLVDLKIKLFQDIEDLKLLRPMRVEMSDGRTMICVYEENLLHVAESIWKLRHLEDD